MPIPAELIELWDIVECETTTVHAYWLVCKQLFDKGQKDILERLPFFFLVVQNALTNDIQLTISKLADPPEVSGKKTATVERLLNEAVILEPALRSELEPLLKKFREASKPIRTLRHKVIAHLDLSTAKGSPLPEVTINEIQVSLDALAAFMNSLATHFGEPETAYGMVQIAHGGPEDLIFMLRAGSRYAELQNSGAIPWDVIDKDLDSSQKE